MSGVRGALAAALAAAALAVGCAGGDGGSRVDPLAGWSPAEVTRGPAAETETVAGPVEVPGGGDADRFVAARVEIFEGTATLALLDAAGGAVARRRVALDGESLVILPVPPAGARLAVLHPKGTGPLRLAVRDVALVTAPAGHAARAAAEVAARFERETGRLADAVEPNLVPNSDFAEDDEVRGTPADWVAFVETSVDAGSHLLRAAGAPPPGRPLVGTAPVRLECGRRYRAAVRIGVLEGAVVVRAVDYDEIETLARSESLAEGEARRTVTLEFAAPPGCRAVRLRVDPAGPGARAAVEVSHVELEMLAAGGA